jgi:processive 1,2-diacylglycerol beta-glucosyltransferase
MYKLMKIADIFIGKPGGMTISEAIACGLPMCVVSPIPGQEEGNSDHLLEEGIARSDHVTLQTGAVAGRSGQVGSNESQCLAFCQTTVSTTIVDTLLEDRLPPLSFTKDQRAAIALAARPE